MKALTRSDSRAFFAENTLNRLGSGVRHNDQLLKTSVLDIRTWLVIGARESGLIRVEPEPHLGINTLAFQVGAVSAGEA